MEKTVCYKHEFTKEIRALWVGCGSHAMRNLFPSLRFTPAKIVGTCDVNVERAQCAAAMLGTEVYGSSMADMIADLSPDVVFLAVGYDYDKRPVHSELAQIAVKAGCHVWMEKPPASSAEEINQLAQLAQQKDKKVGVGFMKMFSTGLENIIRLMNNKEEFGVPTTFNLRDPELMPQLEKRHNHAVMQLFVDHIVHPLSILRRLFGTLVRIYIEEAPNGGCVLALRYASSVCGCLHMPWGQSGTSPMERLEIIGSGANVVLERNMRLVYYPPGHKGVVPMAYGQNVDFGGLSETAPRIWEMDGYSGEHYNNYLFYQGYARGLIYFCHCIVNDTPVKTAGLKDAWHILNAYDALKTIRSGEPQVLPPPPAWAKDE
ncbi:MAG: Gfo/Idh/MocA family oxidoreductase [Desulfarculaceae bacterium]|nr:Gfo/Idh/MocA family oxidoreductase [Desulfarculaceae bacterium]